EPFVDGTVAPFAGANRRKPWSPFVDKRAPRTPTRTLAPVRPPPSLSPRIGALLSQLQRMCGYSQSAPKRSPAAGVHAAHQVAWLMPAEIVRPLPSARQTSRPPSLNVEARRGSHVEGEAWN